MSTVLWVHSMVDGQVHTDEVDRYALYRHMNKLDALCKTLGDPPFSDMCDSTDMQYNLADRDLPEGLASTTELMAREGVWVDATQAHQRLARLLAAIRERQTRFGLLRNDHDAVVAELEAVIAYAGQAAEKNARFNFSMVM